MRPRLAAFLAALASGPCLAAQPAPQPDPSPSPSAASLPLRVPSTHVLVEASPILSEVRSEPLAGSVVSVGREQIEDLNAGDIASALRRLPGVVISRYNPVGSYGGGDGGAVFVRGQGAGRPGAEIVTLVDGIPKFVGVWTHPLLDTLSVDLVERVDVYKSPQPVLFGNMSFAGIDLVPRRETEPGVRGRASAAFGSFDTSALAAQASGRQGRLDWLATGSQRRSDGHRPDADGRTRAAFGRAGVELSPTLDLSLLVDWSDGQAGDPGVAGAPRPPVTPRFETGDTLAVLSLTRRHGGRQGFVKLHLDDGSIDWLQWDAARRESFRSLTDWSNRGLRLQDQFGVGSGGDLTVGGELLDYGGRAQEARPAGTSTLGDFRFQNRAAYAAYTHTLGGRVRVTPSAGLRVNSSREFGWDYGAQAGLQVTGGFGEARLRWARAYNLPGVWVATFYQGYGRGDQWQDLQPEIVEHVEAGFARSLGSRARFDLALFSDDVTHALRFVPPPPPPPAFANRDSYRTRGVELTLAWNPLRGLSLMAGTTFSDTTPERTPYTPAFTLVGGVTWEAGRWRLALDGQQVDERYYGNLRFPGPLVPVPGYFLLNGRLAYRLKDARPAPEVYLAGENLTDGDYAYRPGYPMPGASVMGGLSWVF